MEGVTLTKFKYGLQKVLSEHFANECRVSMERLIDARAVALTITQSIYGQTLEKVEVRYPDGWWQAFKDRWFPGWLKRWRPVRWKYHKLEARALWPKAKAVPLPGPVVLDLSEHSQTFHDPDEDVW
jgi:hypothetical protein